MPLSPNEIRLKTKIEEAAQEVLDVRAKFMSVEAGFIRQKTTVEATTVSPVSLADLYDPLSMPPELTKAHQKLDKLVDEAYRKGGFKDDVERVEWLFGIYKKF